MITTFSDQFKWENPKTETQRWRSYKFPVLSVWVDSNPSGPSRPDH